MIEAESSGGPESTLKDKNDGKGADYIEGSILYIYCVFT